MRHFRVHVCNCLFTIMTKGMKPSLREKKRYVAVEVLSSREITRDLRPVIRESFHEFVGNLGEASAGLQFVKDCCTSSTYVCRVNNLWVDHLKASLLFVNAVEEEPILLRSFCTSGILNKLLERTKTLEKNVKQRTSSTAVSEERQW